MPLSQIENQNSEHQKRIDIIKNQGLTFVFTKQDKDLDPQYLYEDFILDVYDTYYEKGFSVIDTYNIQITEEMARKHYNKTPKGIWKFQTQHLLIKLFESQNNKAWDPEIDGNEALLEVALKLQEQSPNPDLDMSVDIYSQNAYNGLLNTIIGDSKLIVLKKNSDNASNESKEEIVGSTFPKDDDDTLRSRHTPEEFRSLQGAVTQNKGVHNLLHAPDADPVQIYNELLNLLGEEKVAKLFASLK